MKTKNKKIFLILLLISLITLVIGITYAVFNINIKGLININTDNPGISLTYEEPPKALEQSNSILTKEEYKTSNDYFEFKVSSASSTIYDLYYNIYLTEKTNTLSKDNLYIYLTKLNNTTEEEVLESTLVSNLTTYSNYDNSYIITSNNFEFLTEEKETKEITYRLRIWNEPSINSTFISINGGTYEYTVNVETYKITPEYCFNTSESTITGYNCFSGNSYGYETITDVIIPSKINGVTITAINYTKVTYNDTETNNNSSNVARLSTKRFLPEILSTGVFVESNLTSVVLPDTITYIGDNAFTQNKLTSITLGKNLTYIGSKAFYKNNLTSVTIPESVTTIEYAAFASNNLTSVKIKGKSSSSEFTTYGTDIWGWATGYSDSNIIWNYTE